MELENRERRAVAAHQQLEEVVLIADKDALELLSDQGFQAEWDELYLACPWKTVFQSRKFVSTWYWLYSPEYMPLLLKATAGGKMVGLLTLAKARNRSIITGAGESQAFYHTWLSQPTHGQDFIQLALTRLQNRFPLCEVQFKYLPPKTPLNWAGPGSTWRQKCVLIPHARLYMDLKAPDTEELLYSNRFGKKLERLNKLGKVSFERVTSTEQFSLVMDQLSVQYDFRKGAVHNVCPFTDSPATQQFYLALFAQELLHVTALKLNNEIIAAIVAIHGEGGWLHGALNSHAPSYSKYSPGIVDFLMLGQHLVQEEVSCYDLTPGGNSYKARLANAGDEVHQLIVSGRAKALLTKVLLNYVKRGSMHGLSNLGMDPRQVRKKVERAVQLTKERVRIGRRQGLRQALQSLLSSAGEKEQVALYCLGSGISIPDSERAIHVRQNSLHDLLCFEQRGSDVTRWEFLGESMKRLESGETCLSWVDEGCLLACVWVGAQANGMALKSFYFHRLVKECPVAFLASAINHISRGNKVPRLYANARMQQANLVRALVKLGFTKQD